MTQIDDLIGQIFPALQDIIASVMKVGGSGLFGKMRETKSLIDFAQNAAVQFAGNDIVGGLVQRILDPDGDGDLNLDFESLNPADVLGSLGGLNNLLAGFGEQGAQVKQFLYGAAESVAGAAGTGLMGSGQKVNANEQNFLEQLKATLGL